MQQSRIKEGRRISSSTNQKFSHDNNTQPVNGDLLSKEQNHRHAWQDRFLSLQQNTFRIGQLCGFAYNAILLYVVYRLIDAGEKDLALKIFTINAAVILISVIITFSERRIYSKRPSLRVNKDKKPR